MKQKVVLKVSMNCEKCRTKALEVAAKQNEGKEKEKVVVAGEGFDVVKLTTDLRKKLGHAEILTLAEQK
ncbi:hypothetical protein V6N11_025229 [Hibiscus sabdariffa]|uniref:HMA domain-containing protein n=1 Tax=Hibiscus sabdariffa TaxID=183260 RepID=A0ABR2QPF7_9ROSI